MVATLLPAAGFKGAMVRAAEVSEVSDLALPEGIEGLDTALGLKRVLGKVPRYIAMLERYVAGQRGTLRALNAALAAGDRDTAIRLVHTSKGVSGNIGAVLVQQLAEELEQALKSGESFDGLQARVAALQQRLDPMVTAITAQLVRATSPTDPSPESEILTIDEDQLTQVTQRLRKLLSDMDSEAGDWLEQHHVLLSTAYPKKLARIVDAMEQFDFDLAVERLDAAVSARTAAV